MSKNEIVSSPAWTIDVNLNDEIKRLESDRRDAERWRKLIRLTGHVQDGSDATVKLFWDDATYSAHIMVGKKFYGTDQRSFEDIIDSIPEPKV